MTTTGEVTFTFTCGSCNGKITREQNQVYVSSSASECELCGSHGDTTIEARCDCGKTIEIQLSSW